MMMIKIIIITVRYIQLKISKMKRRDLLLLSPFKKTGDVGININIHAFVGMLQDHRTGGICSKERNKQTNKQRSRRKCWWQRQTWGMENSRLCYAFHFSSQSEHLERGFMKEATYQ